LIARSESVLFPKTQTALRKCGGTRSSFVFGTLLNVIFLNTSKVALPTNLLTVKKIPVNISICLVSVGLLAASVAKADKPVDFVKEIQPIFQKSCIECHGPDKHKADLRLDNKEAALKGGKNGPVIVAKDAAKSDLYHRITLPAGNDDVMPSKGDLLTKEQTDLIAAWINQGAIWPDEAVIKSTETVVEKKLADFKPAPEELKAVPVLEKSGVAVRPIALNVNWKEASFRSLGTNATDALIAPIKDVKGLVDLSLAGTRVTDSGLSAIKGLTNLTRLHLEHTKVGDAGLAHLKALSNLTYLNLFDTVVTDAGLKELSGLSGLKQLYVWQTKVTDEGIAQLKAQNPKLSVYKGWETNAVAKVEEKKPEAKK
jgi:mono/diheme cytochrome c family protein